MRQVFGVRVACIGKRAVATVRAPLSARLGFWATGFVVPYAAVFLAFTVRPIGYALWMASKLTMVLTLLIGSLAPDSGIIMISAIRSDRRSCESRVGHRTERSA
jgi:hypothetical protein